VKPRRVLRRVDSPYHGVSANTYLVAIDSMVVQKTPAAPARFSDALKVSALLVLGSLLFFITDQFIFSFPAFAAFMVAAAYIGIHLVVGEVIGRKYIIPSLLVSTALLVMAALL
jgi:hypothetical protein